MPNKSIKKHTPKTALKNFWLCVLRFCNAISDKFFAQFSKLISKQFFISKTTKSTDTFKSSIFKILLLYVGTSVLFLGIIFFMMYKKELHNLRAKQSIQMRNDFIQIATAMYEKDFKTTKGMRKENLKKEEKKEKKLRKYNPVLSQELHKQIEQTEENQKLKDKQRQQQNMEFLEHLQAIKNKTQDNKLATPQNPPLQDSLGIIDSLDSKHNAKSSNSYPNVFAKSKEISPDLIAFLDEMGGEINSPFALLDEDLGVVYSNLGVELESIPEVFINHQGFFSSKDFIFVNFSRNKEILFRHPFGTSKMLKPVSKYIERQGWIFILQGEAVNIGSEFGIFGTTKRQEENLSQSNFIQPKEIESIKNEILSIRFEIIAYMLLCLLIVSVIAYTLTRLSLRPIKEQIRHLERFIKDTTHEVNTPLSVILMSVQKFDTTSLSEENKKRLHHIKLSAQNLHQMYQNLIFLNFYQGKNSTQIIELKTLVNERLEYFSTLLAQKNIKLNANLNRASINANKEEITIMLDNLISNAIKYNHKGGNISIYLEHSTLEISDSGYGIEKKDLDSIFERYKRFNDDKGGFGIGLSLVSEIASKYGIAIKAQSELGKGSTFRLSWRNNNKC